MKIESTKIDSDIKLHMDDIDNYEVTDDNGVDIWLTEGQQRIIAIWLWKNRPEIIMPIVCENCPEHLGNRKPGIPEHISQALNEGDGVYRP